MLMIKLRGTLKVTISAGDNFNGNTSIVYNNDVIHFLETMECECADIEGEIRLLHKFKDKEEKKALEDLFDTYKTEKDLPPWLGIKVEE